MWCKFKLNNIQEVLHRHKNKRDKKNKAFA